jgi:hypothetical protein
LPLIVKVAAMELPIGTTDRDPLLQVDAENSNINQSNINK